MGYRCKILADSLNSSGSRLTSMEITFPRIILAEFNTHRVFSRNSASSRAIPFEKMVAMVESDPFVPGYWGQNQRGMQAEKQISDEDARLAVFVWHNARNTALNHAEQLHRLGVHKQTVNRLLEPFMWHTVIVTSSEWDNFFALRDSPMAQPEMQTIAKMMREAYLSSEPAQLRAGQWHAPYYTMPHEWEASHDEEMEAAMRCAARCARVSYLTHDGKEDPDADLALANRLLSAGHMSPFEHVAKDVSYFMSGNFGTGWKQLRKFFPNEDNYGAMAKE